MTEPDRDPAAEAAEARRRMDADLAAEEASAVDQEVLRDLVQEDQLDQALRDLTTAADDQVRRQRVDAIVDALAFSASAAVVHRWRDAITALGYIGRRDWAIQYSEARKRIERSRQQARREEPAQPDYTIGEDGCLYLCSPQGTIQLARFVPRVVAEVTRDDGAEVTKLIRVEVALPTGQRAQVDVAAERLHQSRRWSAQAVGAAAIITPISRDEAHVANAAQQLGNYGWTSEVVYAHTGWRSDLGSGHRYLTHSGALGANGLDPAVTVDLGGERANGYSLPDPADSTPEQLRAAIRASLDLHTLAPAKVMAAMLGAAYRAPLPVQPETSVFVVGPTGSLKTALSAVICQHYGRALAATNLPAEWKSTANALEITAHQLAGALLVIDDYAPQAAEDPRKLAAAADRVFRGSANSSGRGRLRPDGTPRPVKPPRAQVLSTGEDVPPGESLRARLTIATIASGDVDRKALTGAQRQARDGVFELAMAGYISWLAARQDRDPEYAADLRRQMQQLREQLAADGHLRVPESAAGLLTGWQQWLAYATEAGALTTQQSRTVMDRAFTAVAELAAEQSDYAREQRVEQVYLDGIRSALTGGSAHLADQSTGTEPRSDARLWGWRERYVGQVPEWQPQGVCIGWVSKEGEVYLAPGPAYEMARQHAGRAAAPLNTTMVTVHKRLNEAGRLASTNAPRHLTVVRKVISRNRRVLHVQPDLLTGSSD